MQIDELKKLIKNSTAVLVLDNGQPSFVVVDYKMYKDLVSDRVGEKEVKIIKEHHANHSFNGNPRTERVEQQPSVAEQSPHGRSSYDGYTLHERDMEILERLNKEILALRNQIESEERGLGNASID